MGHQRRHLAGWLEAKQKLDEGIIGTPLQLTINSGALLNVMSHDVNMAQFLLGDRPWEWVMGAVERTTDRFERSFPCEDASMGIAQVEGGVQIVMGGALPTGGRGHGCRIVGTEGIMELHVTRPPVEEIPPDGDMRSRRARRPSTTPRTATPGCCGLAPAAGR